MPSKTFLTTISMDGGVSPPAPEDDMIVGMRFDFAGTAPPPKALVADGSAVSRTTYALLFAAIGTTWGPGDGVTTFNLPDDRDKHSRGKGAGTAVGQAVGSDTHTLTVAEMPSHNHNTDDPGHGHLLPMATLAPVSGNQSVFGAGNAPDIDFTGAEVAFTGVTNENTGGGGTHPNIPASNVYLPCIYAGA